MQLYGGINVLVCRLINEGGGFALQFEERLFAGLGSLQAGGSAKLDATAQQGHLKWNA